MNRPNLFTEFAKLGKLPFVKQAQKLEPPQGCGDTSLSKVKLSRRSSLLSTPPLGEAVASSLPARVAEASPEKASAQWKLKAL